jgi:hypothetical protein
LQRARGIDRRARRRARDRRSVRLSHATSAAWRSAPLAPPDLRPRRLAGTTRTIGLFLPAVDEPTAPRGRATGARAELGIASFVTTAERRRTLPLALPNGRGRDRKAGSGSRTTQA